jgi:hypothetical protein
MGSGDARLRFRGAVGISATAVIKLLHVGDQQRPGANVDSRAREVEEELHGQFRRRLSHLSAPNRAARRLRELHLIASANVSVPFAQHANS